MKTSPRYTLLISAGLSLFFWMPGAGARVFLSGGGAPLANAAQEAGFKPVYQTEYAINGVPTMLEVYAAEMPVHAAARALEQSLRARRLNASIPVSDSGAAGVLSTKQELTRLTFMQAGPAKTLVYAVRQTAEDAARLRAAGAAAGAANAALPDIPAYPGARLVYHVEDRKTKTALAVYRSNGTPEIVRDFYARSLPENGWQSMHGLMYRRGPMNCMISVQTTQQAGDLTITVLVRHSAL